MIEERATRLSRHTLIALSAFFPVLCAGQTSAPPSTRLSAPSNPRASSSDPRIGLKGGLYDAGEAAFGMEKVTSIPKPPGFAPDNFIPITNPPEHPEEPAPGQPARPPAVQYGSTNSDL